MNMRNVYEFLGKVVASMKQKARQTEDIEDASFLNENPARQ